jgi:hypothetical protein
MKSLTRSGLLVGFFTSLLFAGCSPADIFQKLSGTAVDQAAGEKIEQSEILLKKLERIEAKKQSFSEFVQLGSVDPDLEIAAIAFRNDYTLDQKTLIEVEAILPSASNKYYEVWVTGADKPPLSLGALEYLNLEDYFLSFETHEDLSEYTEIFITDELNADDTPEERVLIGTFGNSQ